MKLDIYSMSIIIFFSCEANRDVRKWLDNVSPRCPFCPTGPFRPARPCLSILYHRVVLSPDGSILLPLSFRVCRYREGGCLLLPAAVIEIELILRSGVPSDKPAGRSGRSEKRATLVGTALSCSLVHDSLYPVSYQKLEIKPDSRRERPADSNVSSRLGTFANVSIDEIRSSFVGHRRPTRGRRPSAISWLLNVTLNT